MKNKRIFWRLDLYIYTVFVPTVHCYEKEAGFHFTLMNSEKIIGRLTFSFCFKLVTLVHQVAQKWVIKIRQDIFLEKIKGDFQYVLRTLQSLFAFFVLFHVTHENVNISQLHEACKFIVLKRMRSVTLCSFSRHLMNQLRSCKYQWSCWKNNLKGLKDKICGS